MPLDELSDPFVILLSTLAGGLAGYAVGLLAEYIKRRKNLREQ